MESHEFDEMFEQAARAGKLLMALFRAVTDEDLDLESAVRHRPLIALGLAAGSGALAGWWLGQKARPRLPEQKPKPHVLDLVRDLDATLRKRPDGAPGEPSRTPMEFLEQVFPEGIDRIRGLLPEMVSEEVTEMARDWVDTRLTQGIETVVTNVSETRVGLFLRQAIQRRDAEEGE